MFSRSCKYGANCRYNHPDRNGNCCVIFIMLIICEVNLICCDRSFNTATATELSSPFSVINPSSAVVGHAVLPALASVSAGLINPAASIFQSLQPGLPQTTVIFMVLFWLTSKNKNCSIMSDAY